ncbi:MAG: ABC transporter permease [Chitinophagales bacterium]|nr:ABC transporter permease [Chitinophagales bacterium]
MHTLTIKPRSSWQIINPPELWEFRELFYIFAWRDIKVPSKQTVLGIVWVLLQPLLSMVIFTVFFGNFAKIPSDGLPYPVFVLLGLVFWGYFSGALSRASTAFIDNENLVKKVYFPREILPFSTVVTAFIDFLVSLVLFVIVALVYHVHFNLLFLGMVLLSIIITTLCAGLKCQYQLLIYLMLVISSLLSPTLRTPLSILLV